MIQCLIALTSKRTCTEINFKDNSVEKGLKYGFSPCKYVSFWFYSL